MLDWSEAGHGDPMFDLATLTLATGTDSPTSSPVTAPLPTRPLSAPGGRCGAADAGLRGGAPRPAIGFPGAGWPRAMPCLMHRGRTHWARRRRAALPPCRARREPENLASFTAATDFHQEPHVQATSSGWEPELLGQVLPADTCVQHEQDPLQHQPIRQWLRPRPTRRPERQQRLNPGPQLVGHNPGRSHTKIISEQDHQCVRGSKSTSIG